MSVAQTPIPALIGRACDGVFPLPLTPMEATLLLADGRPGYPMLADIQLEFDGLLDRDLFTAALSAARAARLLNEFLSQIASTATQGLSGEANGCQANVEGENECQ